MDSITAFELDHFFVFCTEDAPEISQLIYLGFTEGESNQHPGQGTACRRFFFRNAYLEFVWVKDEAEIRSEVVKPTKLWERSRHEETGYCPFGIGLRRKTGTITEPMPFSTWAYCPPYLPPSMSIEVADTQDHPEDPFVFYLERGDKTGQEGQRHVSDVAHSSQVGDLTHLEITLPTSEMSEEMRILSRVGSLEIRPGTEYLAVVYLDGWRQGREADFRPGLPLVLKW
jgi:hypothetical protein